jgi:hypothetical protein
MNGRFDWTKIKAEYATTNVTQQALADKYGCTVATINRHIKADNWGKDRNDFRKKAIKKCADKRAARQAITYDKELSALDCAVKILADALKDPEQFKDSKGKINSMALRNAVATLRDASQIKKDIDGISNIVDAKDRERLEIEKKKADTNLTDDDDITGVILLPKRAAIGSKAGNGNG